MKMKAMNGLVSGVYRHVQCIKHVFAISKSVRKSQPVALGSCVNLYGKLPESQLREIFQILAIFIQC